MVDSKTAILISVFVALIIGVVLIGPASEQILDVTGLTSNGETQYIVMINSTDVNETYEYTLTNAPSLGPWQYGAPGDSSDGCPITNFVMTNGTGEVLTDATDYTVDLEAGTYTMGNTSNTVNLADNTTTIAYSSCGDDYQSGWGATMLTLIPGFFALAVLLVVAFLIFDILKREGINI